MVVHKGHTGSDKLSTSFSKLFIKLDSFRRACQKLCSRLLQKQRAHRENFLLIHRLFYALKHMNLHPSPKVLESFLFVCVSALYYNNCGYFAYCP